MIGWLLVKDQNSIFDWLRFGGRSQRHRVPVLNEQAVGRPFPNRPASLETDLWIQGLLQLQHCSPEVLVPCASQGPGQCAKVVDGKTGQRDLNPL